MKHLLIFIIILFSCAGFAQDTSIDKGSGYLYFSDIPGTTPNTGCCSELAFNTADQSFWHWNRDSSVWKRTVNITQQGGAPTVDPGTSPKLYLDTNTYKLYWWNGSGWDDLTTGGGGGGGAVSSVFSRTGAVAAASGDYNAGQITNTPAGNIAAIDVQAALNELDTEKLSAEVDGSVTNEIQTLSISNDSLSISSGNTVVIPGDDLGNHTATQNINIGTNHLSPDGGGYGLKLTAAGDLIVENSGFVGTELRITEASANGDDAIILKAPDNMSSDINFNFPNSEGTVDQVLRTDGSGNLSWVDQTGGGGGSSAIDTFANMAAARLVTINAKLVYLSDDKIKGFFEPVESGVDNGITRFVDNGSQVWERIVNNGDIELAWDEDAENDADKIIDAITLADVGGTVWLEDADYEIEKAITLTNGKKIKVRGNNTVLYRDTILSFVISEATSTSQNWIKGASVDFETQMEVSVITGNTDSDVQAFTGGSFRAIVLSISGDTIFLDKNLGGDWNGYEVITSHPLIRAQGQPINIEGITFDERRNINNKNYSWRILGVIHSNQETVIRGNTFNNIISTVAFLPYGSIKGNVCDSLITLAHITKNPNPTLGTNKLVTVRDNFISYAGLNAAECNHCEGALVTFSNGTENLTVENNSLFWIKNAVVGDVSHDDKRVRIVGNTAINPDSSYTNGSAFRVTNNAGSHVNTYDDAGLDFANNYFWQVGNVEILGGNDATGNATYLATFRNNKIINGKVRFQKIQTLHMSGNTIGFTEAFDYPGHTLGLSDDLDRFALVFQGVNHSEFYNNKVIASVKSDSLWGGVALTNSYYNKFFNTHVKGYEVGISTRQTTSGTQHDFELLFNGGVIEVRDTSSIAEGAACFKIGRGVTVMNFELVAHGGNPFITNLATSGESTKMGVRLANNYIHSNLYALYAIAGKTGDAILKDNYGYAFAAGDSGLGSGDWSDGTERTIRDGNTFMLYSDSDVIPYPLPLPRIDLISYE